MPDYLADDYPDIAKRMRNLSEPPRPVRWGLWYLRDAAWIRIMSNDDFATCKHGAREPTTFSSKEAEDEQLAKRPHITQVVVKEYED